MCKKREESKVEEETNLLLLSLMHAHTHMWERGSEEEGTEEEKKSPPPPYARMHMPGREGDRVRRDLGEREEVKNLEKESRRKRVA